MVVFTCSHCGEAVKKNQVEKHYQFSCRGNFPALTCVDCLKDFNGEEYVSHVSCVTEEERYSAKGFVSKTPSGKKKQEEWVNSIKTIIDSNPNADAQVKRLLGQIINDAGVPRKKPKFLNYCLSKFRNTFHKTTYESAWELLEKKKEELINRTVQNGGKCDTPAEVNSESLKDKKRKRVDSSKDCPSEVKEESEMFKNVISMENSETSKGKKKKQKKEGQITNVIIHNDENDAHQISKKDKKKRKQMLLSESIQTNEGQSTNLYANEEQTDESKKQVIENGVQEQENGLVLLSKKEKKEKRKRQKYEKQLLDVQSEAVSNSAQDVQTNQDDDTTHSKKKKKKHIQENGNSLSHEQLSTVQQKSKTKKHQQLDEVASNQNTGFQEEQTETALLKPQKFNWEEIVIKVLESKGELPLKRLEKKVVSEYINSGAHVESVEKVSAKFNKKVMKMHRVVVKKDVAKLQS